MEDSILDNLEGSTDPLQLMIPYPNFNARLTAFLIDSIILIGVFIIVWILGSWWSTLRVYSYLLLLVFSCYKTWMEGKHGRTIGKGLMRIVLVQANHRLPITFQQAAFRNVFWWGFCLLVASGCYLEQQLAGFWLQAPWYWWVPEKIDQFLPWYLMIGALNYALLLITKPPRAITDQAVRTMAITTDYLSKETT